MAADYQCHACFLGCARLDVCATQGINLSDIVPEAAEVFI